MEITFSDIVHITSQHNQILYTGYFLHILHLDTIKSEINFKLKVKMNEILMYGFQLDIDHSNPYIHSTTVLCDNLLDECQWSETDSI